MASDILLRKALAALRAGDLRVAAGLSQQLLAIDCDHPDVWFIGAVCSLEAGQLNEAMGGFRAATTRDPARADYWAQFARCQAMLGCQVDARASVTRAAGLPINDALTHDTLGNVLTRLGAYAEATPHFEQAAALDPGHAQYRYNMATALMFAGQLERAEAAYQRVLELDPDNSRAWTALVDLLDGPPPDGRVAELQAALDRAEGHVDQSLLIGHALARTLESADDPVAAMDVWRRTKSARKAAVRYTIDEDKAIFTAVREIFPDSAALESAAGDPSAAPIFIVGMARTGTTLLERMLGSHSAITAAGETMYLPMAVHEAGRGSPQRLIDPAALRAAASQDPAAIGQRYLARVRTSVGDAARFTEKFPLNFLYVGFIRMVFPKARIVCLRRGALDTCLASFRQLFALNFPYFRYALSLEDTAEYIGLFEDLMAHWDNIAPGAICQVRYEDLVRAPEPELRRLLAALDLEFEPDMLNFVDNRAPVATASAVQVRRPVHQRSVGAWRRYADALEPARRKLLVLGVDPGTADS